MKNRKEKKIYWGSLKKLEKGRKIISASLKYGDDLWNNNKANYLTFKFYLTSFDVFTLKKKTKLSFLIYNTHIYNLPETYSIEIYNFYCSMYNYLNF